MKIADDQPVSVELGLDRSGRNIDKHSSHPDRSVLQQISGISELQADGGVGRFVSLSSHRSRKYLMQFDILVLLVCSLFPATAIWTMLDHVPFTGAFIQTSLALIVSITAAWYALRELRSYANARAVAYVLPVNLSAFMGVVTFLAFARIPYSGSLLALGAVFAVATSFLLAIYGRNLVRPHLIVAGGRASEIVIGDQYVPAPNKKTLEHLIESGWRDWAIVADLHYPHSEHYERLFAKAALSGIPVYHFRTIAEELSGQVKINHLSENEFGSIIPNTPYMGLKRLLDIVGALTMIPLCIPIFVALALLIRLSSPGKALFIQERVGYRGRIFRMIKFRTMRERPIATDDADERNDAMTKCDDDRITPIGRFLRKTRLDELPQIVNVLRGEMSFIGPRPEACALSHWYQSELPFYSYRHIVRPGITGWAQVNQGHVTDVEDVLAKLRYDFYYIKNFSLWLDILIVLKTFRVILTGSGAK